MKLLQLPILQISFLILLQPLMRIRKHLGNELDQRAQPSEEIVINHPVPFDHVREIHHLHPRPPLPLLEHHHHRRRVEMIDRLILEPRFQLEQLSQHPLRPPVHLLSQSTVQIVAVRHEPPQDPPDVGRGELPDVIPARLPAVAAAGSAVDLEAGDAESEGEAGGLAVLLDALLEVGLGVGRGPGAGPDLEVDDGGSGEVGGDVLEDEVGVVGTTAG